MEILQFLLSFFLNEYGGGNFKPILELFKENSFDLKKVLQNLKPETVAPIIKDFMSKNNNKSPTDSVGQVYGLNPIVKIADKEIVYTLNNFFYEPVS